MMCSAFTLSGYAMQPVVTLTGGTTTLSAQQSQTLSFDDTLFEYHPNHTSTQQFIAGGFIGEEYSLNKKWAWQLGLAFYQITSFSITGNETQAPAENSVATNSWNYQYKISSSQLLVENKLLFALRKRYHPYLLAGVGAAFNHVYGFQATQQNSGEVATANFADNQNSSLIYTLGFGVDIDIIKRMRMGIGYRFAYLGKYDLGKGTLDTGIGGNVFSTPALHSTNAFNHAVVIQLTYLF